MTKLLSKELFEGTAESHRLIERMPFVSTLLSKKLSADKYREYLIDLYFVYSALEEELEIQQNHHMIQQFSCLHLNRKSKILQDLQHFSCFKISSHHETKATKAYVKRIRWCSENYPYLLIAHMYVRYMGDLSGGQILKKRLSKTFDANALSFFEFEEDCKQMKQSFRSILDSLALEEGKMVKLIEEANIAFKLSGKIFSELLPVSQPQQFRSIYIIATIAILVLPHVIKIH